MNTQANLMLALWLSGFGVVWADGINERVGPDPGTQAAVNYEIAHAWATHGPPADQSVIEGGSEANFSDGTNMNLNIGNEFVNNGGQASTQHTTITGNITQICCFYFH